MPLTALGKGEYGSFNENTTAEMMGSGKTEVNHAQRGSGKFTLAAAAVETFIRMKKKLPIARAPWPYLSSGIKQTLCLSTERPEPNGLVGDVEEVVGDGAASSSLPALSSALPSPLISQKLQVGEKLKQEIGNAIPLESKVKIWG